MPHGLFLGSHLATIDRLDTAPQPPTPRTEELSLVSLLRRVKSAATSDSGASAKDWKKILTQGWRKQENPCEAPEAENPEDPAYDADRVEKWEKEQVRYEAEVKAFDRVDHVKTSIAHSTVGYSSESSHRSIELTRSVSGGHRFIASGIRGHYQQCYPDLSFCRILLWR